MPRFDRIISPILLPLLLTLAPSLISGIMAQPHPSNSGEFNTQVMLRVMERLEDFMRVPVLAAARAETMRNLRVFFPNQLQGQERNVSLPFLFADVPHTLYFGLEDGTFMIVFNDKTAGYREPGESYRISRKEDDAEQQQFTEKEKLNKRLFYQQCVDRITGASRNCTMDTPGSPYIRCVDDCALKPCSRNKYETSGDCYKLSTEKEKGDCLVSIYQNTTYWCPHYTIESLSQHDADAGSIGYIPLTHSCLSSEAQLEEGRFRRVLHSGGDCYFGDGKTLVNRSHVSGQYQYCQTQQTPLQSPNNNTPARQSCSGVFTGGFRSQYYDPRFRGWYRTGKELQSSSWSTPYAFYTMEIGITYSLPMHIDYTPSSTTATTTTTTTTTTTPTAGGGGGTVRSTRPAAKQFYGVWGVDVSLSQITEFLTTQYTNNTNMWVLVLDTSPPYNVIASSTGSPAAKKVLANDPSQPCPANEANEPTDVVCDVVRVPIAELSGNDDERGDQIVRRSFDAYQDAGFPDMSELIGFKIDDEIGSDAFVAQGGIYEQEGSNNLQWYVLVSMPMVRSNNDAVLPGTSAFITVTALATVGVVGCLLLFVIIYQKRKERAFINGDWRFTSAFILGCSALNISTYTLLGENTNPLCILRMWAFNLLFAITLSPLLVKVWRMHRIVTAAVKMERLKISNLQAWLYTLPIPLVEVALLVIFSIADTPSQVETMKLDDGSGVLILSCGQESVAFHIVQVSYHGILVFTGCVLAYRSRALEPAYGEAKQLGFAMYNLAFTYIIIVTIFQVAEIDQVGRVVLQAIGTLWATVFSGLAFVLPRLIQVQQTYATKRMRKTVKKFLKKTSDWEARVSAVVVDLNKASHHQQQQQEQQFTNTTGAINKRESAPVVVPSRDNNDNQQQKASMNGMTFLSARFIQNEEKRASQIGNRKRIVIRSSSWTRESTLT